MKTSFKRTYKIKRIYLFGFSRSVVVIIFGNIFEWPHRANTLLFLSKT